MSHVALGILLRACSKASRGVKVCGYSYHFVICRQHWFVSEDARNPDSIERGWRRSRVRFSDWRCDVLY